MRITELIFLAAITNPSGFAQELPNHLEPINGRLWAVGLAQAERSLLPRGYATYWMIAAPSFSPGWSVSIVLDDRFAQNPKHTVWFIQADGPILAPPTAPSLNGKPIKLRPYRPRPVLKQSAFIESQIANRITKVWHKCVKATRYFGDAAFHGGLDGTSYFFCSESHYFGETWGPLPGTPTALVDLATALSKYPQVAIKDRPVALNGIIQKCEELEKCLQ